MSFQDHFSKKASVYAKSRPNYPPALFAELARLAPGRSLAWDCGTGNGQAAVGLARHFARVVATEPSTAQLAEAVAHPHVTYVLSAELAPGVADRSADLVTAAQAVHWFDLGIFYPEVRRVLRPGGLLALWNYSVCTIDPLIDATLGYFYRETVGPYWPPARKHAANGYRDLEFPFEEISWPRLDLELSWTVKDFTAYLRTWSSVTQYTEAVGTDPVAGLEPDLHRLWGSGRRRVVWPLGGRLGRV